MVDTFESRLREVVTNARLNHEQAAAHLLNRLTYGARPGEVDRVAAMGLETWLAEQLDATLPEPELEARLAAFPALRLDAQQQVGRYPDIHLVYAHARRFYDLIPPAGTPVDAEVAGAADRPISKGTRLSRRGGGPLSGTGRSEAHPRATLATNWPRS